MAKKSSIQKTLNKRRLASKHGVKRKALLEQMANPEISFEERMLLQDKLENLPINSSKVRDRNRCWLTGRPRGFHRDLGVCRNALRIMGHRGEVPGMTKSSW